MSSDRATPRERRHEPLGAGQAGPSYSFLLAQLWHFREARDWLTKALSQVMQVRIHHLSGATFWVMK